MNKKNKGFTIIEVLATVTIIAIISLIATIAYNKVKKNILNKQYLNLKSLIEIAGVKYSAKTGINSFFVEELIREGYIEPDDDTRNIYDPRDDHSLNCHIVNVTIDDNENHFATLGDIQYRNNDGCDLNRLAPYLADINLTVLIHDTSVNYLTATSANDLGQVSKSGNNIYENVKIVIDSGSRWTNRQVDITANIFKESNSLPNYFDMSEVRYIWNRNPDTQTINDPTYTTSMNEFYNDYFYVDAYTKDDKHLQSKFMYRYDKQKPVIYEEKTKYANASDENKWAQYKYILLYATDKDGVGLAKIYIGTRPCEDLKKDSKMGVAASPHGQVHKYKVDDIETGVNGNNGKVNLCAIDKLGNLAEPKEFNLTKIDITAPHCKQQLNAKRSRDVVGEHNKYQKLPRTVFQYCYDNNVINGKLVQGSGCSTSASGAHKDGNYVYYSKTWSSTTKVGYITLHDNVGHTTKCPVNVYVDTTAPVCAKVTGHGSTSSSFTKAGVGSLNNWDISDRSIRQYCADANVGCKESFFSDQWHRDLGTDSSAIITTDKITIYDKVPKCSQTSTTSDNCANYQSIKNTAENLDDYNNHRDCTVGVYIDHVPPKAGLKYKNGYPGNWAKVYCRDDCNGNCTVYSGIKTFTATIGGNAMTERYNYLQRKINSTGSYTVEYYCEDKATNTDSGTDTYSVGNKPSGNIVNTTSGKTCTYDGKTCYMDNIHDWSGMESCIYYSYDCYCQDAACPTANNAGAGQTCCLTGENYKWGCKQPASNDVTFSSDITGEEVPGTGEIWFVYNGTRYTFPNDMSECTKVGNTWKCGAGRECLHYKCYMDNPETSRPLSSVCGNFAD